MESSDNGFKIPATLVVDSAAIREVISSAFAEVMLQKGSGVKISEVPTNGELVTPPTPKKIKLKLSSTASFEDRIKQVVSQTLQQAHGISHRWGVDEDRALLFCKALYPDISLRSLAETITTSDKSILEEPPSVWLSSLIASASEKPEDVEDMSRNTIDNPIPETGPPVRDVVRVTASEVAPVSASVMSEACTICGAPTPRHFSDCPSAATAPAGPCKACGAPPPKHYSDCETLGQSVPQQRNLDGGAIPARMPTGRQPHPSETGGRHVDTITPERAIEMSGLGNDVIPCPKGGRGCSLPHRIALSGNIKVPVHTIQDVQSMLADLQAAQMPIPTATPEQTNITLELPEKPTETPTVRRASKKAKKSPEE